MGRNWAIVVGINHYENLRSLNFAKRDAAAMASWFRQEARFEQVFLFTDDSPPIATNPPIPTQPTFGHVRRFLRAQFENIETPLLKPEDNLWFFFAGHGNRYQDRDYLMFSDSDPGDIEHTAISVDYVTQRLRRSGADNVVLFLDACRDESSRSGLGIGEQRHQGVITFYSCTANQKAYEIDELQHGSFTHSLLEGLRIQGEANCATVERLAQYLRYQVPAVNSRYGKAVQNPYWQAEPPYKMYFILLEQTATLRDVEPLKYQASQAENRGDLLLAKQLWVRVLAVSRGDEEAIEAIERIARKRGGFEQTTTTSKPATSSSGGRFVSSEPTQESLLAQNQEEHRQNLVRYQQAVSEAIKREFPLTEASRRKLRKLQLSLQLTNEEISQIEQPIVAQKELEYRQLYEKEKRKQEHEAQNLRQQQATIITTTTPITRKQFFKWAGLGGAALVTAVVGWEIFKGQSLTPNGKVAKSEPAASASPKPLPPGAYPYRAKVTWAQGLTMRTEPKQDAERVGGVGFNQKVVILEATPDQLWQKIRQEDINQEGWIKAGGTQPIEVQSNSNKQKPEEKPTEVAEEKLQKGFPVTAENKGVTFSVQSARYSGGDLLLKVKMQNKGADSVRFLYSFLDVTDDKGRTLSASTEGLPAELPANGPAFSGTVSIPKALLDDVKKVSLALTDYPTQQLKLEVVDILLPK